MKRHFLSELRAMLEELGRRLLDLRARGAVHGVWEGDQMKAEADLTAHRFLVEQLRRLAPEIPVVSEEDRAGHAGMRPHRYWLVDPIDGTASYCGGYDGFVTQVALMEDCRPILAAVHAPALGLTWSAHEAEGAWLNGGTLPILELRDEPPTLIDNYPSPRGVAEEIYRDLGFRRYVESGSLGLKICRVADGTADLFIKDVTVRDWDLAPGHLILACVGGVLRVWNGPAPDYIGGFERHGVIAARSAVLADRVALWRTRAETGG